MCKQEFDERSRDVIVQLAEQVTIIDFFWFDITNLGRSIVYTVESRKFKVLGTRGFISYYQWLEL